MTKKDFSEYEIEYNYGFGNRPWTRCILAHNKKEAIKELMLTTAKCWPFCFGIRFRIYHIKKRGEWNKRKLDFGCWQYEEWKELKSEDIFVDKYKHYLCGLIENGTIEQISLI